MDSHPLGGPNYYRVEARQELTAAGMRLATITGEVLPVNVQGGVGIATLSLRGLAPGVYILQVKTATGWQVCRVIKN
jgi:hypothetical protein